MKFILLMTVWTTCMALNDYRTIDRVEVHTREGKKAKSPGTLSWYGAKKLDKRCGIYDHVAKKKMFQARPAKKGEFPSAVAILSNKGDTLCTGSVISERHILTAAHCLFRERKSLNRGCLKTHVTKKMQDDTIRVLFGVLNLQTEPSIFKAEVKQAYTPIDFDSCALEVKLKDHTQMTYDIAILELAEDIPSILMYKQIFPLCVSQDVDSNTRYTMYGYGDDPEAGKNQDNILRTEFVQRGEVGKDCDGLDIGADSICIKEQTGAIACRGDSGGPLIYKYFSGGQQADHIAGIFSAGTECDRITAHGRKYCRGARYTNVTKYVHNGFICTVTGIC